MTGFRARQIPCCSYIIRVRCLSCVYSLSWSELAEPIALETIKHPELSIFVCILFDPENPKLIFVTRRENMENTFDERVVRAAIPSYGYIDTDQERNIYYRIEMPKRY